MKAYWSRAYASSPHLNSRTLLPTPGHRNPVFRVGRLMQLLAEPLERLSLPALSMHAHSPSGPLAQPQHTVDVWTPLGAPPNELTLAFCLPTGQSFRWRQEEASGMFVGVIGQRLVRMRQAEDDCHYQVLARGSGVNACDDDEAIREYFNLPRSSGDATSGVSLAELGVGWAQACPRYAHIQPYIPGARMLRQPPVECLFEFICSSNNHISRIHGMVQRLCEAYGTPLHPTAGEEDSVTGIGRDSTAAGAAAAQEQSDAGGVAQAAAGTGGAATLAQSAGVVAQAAAAAAAVTSGASGVAGTTGTAGVKGEAQRGPPGTPGREQQRGTTTTTAGATPPPAPVSTTQGKKRRRPASPAPQPTAATGATLEPDHTPPTSATATAAAADGRAGAPSSSSPASSSSSAAVQGGAGVVASAPVQGGTGVKVVHYAFPTLDQLARATDEELRAAGFGYRAKFIVGSVQALASKPGGGEAWLLGLRHVSYQEAAASLVELPGVGPKVAACVCLFALDKHEAIPVDTHVWQIATKYYLPSLKGKTLTKKIMAEVQEAFVTRFGPYAGWAHNALFISELATHKQRIPAPGTSSK